MLPACTHASGLTHLLPKTGLSVCVCLESLKGYMHLAIGAIYPKILVISVALLGVLKIFRRKVELSVCFK